MQFISNINPPLHAPRQCFLSLHTAGNNPTATMTFILVLVLLAMTHATLRIHGYEDLSNTDRVSHVVDLVQEPRVTNLPYGVLLKKVRVLDMLSSTWPLIFRIPHVPPLPEIQKYDVCSKLPTDVFNKIDRETS